MTQTIGFIGLGMMGHGIAKNLLKKGYALRFKAHRNRASGCSQCVKVSPR